MRVREEKLTTTQFVSLEGPLRVLLCSQAISVAHHVETETEVYSRIDIIKIVIYKAFFL